MQDEPKRPRSLAMRAAGWVTTPFCYLLMLSVVITAARRSPAGR